MRIGIFGGCFNPPHKMHLDIALELIQNGYLDKVIYVPASNKYNKPGLVSNNHRYQMLKLMTSKYPMLEVSDFEFQEQLKYTYETLDYFKKKYSNDEIYFIMGADNLDEFDTWRNYEYMLSNYKMLVIRRDGTSTIDALAKYQKYQHNIIITNLKAIMLSSTYIRHNITDANINKYLDLDVLTYIKDNHLYEKRSEYEGNN